jgi:rare lipoprotein A
MGWALIALILAGCAEVQLLGHTAKVVGDRVSPEGAAPEGVYKIGTPYQVDGVWYYPQEDPDYDATGIASWYGADFHGRPTANGDIYDLNEVSGAHQTLPLPSLVRVTNLENGRSLMVRVNDRGPFVNGRIIDLSRRAAQLLGFEQKGTARVRVQLLASPAPDAVFAAAGDRPSRPVAKTDPMLESPPMAHASLAPATPRTTAQTVDLNAQAVGHEPVRPTEIFIQVGAFAQMANAARLRSNLASFGEARLSPIRRNGAELYRVRVGPVPTVADADRKLHQLIAAGHHDARIVVD